MIILDAYKLFRDNKSTLRETSKDTSGEKIQYVTESTMEVVDFDKVKQCYTKNLHVSENEVPSADALMQREEAVTFIEFKNGKVQNKNIKDKIRCSLLMFCDITNMTLQDTRKSVEFVVVYNEDKNPSPNQLKKEKITDSPSKDRISEYFMHKSGEEFIRFGLEEYKKLFFHEVHTYSKSEFEEYLKGK